MSDNNKKKAKIQKQWKKELQKKSTYSGTVQQKVDEYVKTVYEKENKEKGNDR